MGWNQRCIGIVAVTPSMSDAGTFINVMSGFVASEFVLRSTKFREDRLGRTKAGLAGNLEDKSEFQNAAVACLCAGMPAGTNKVTDPGRGRRYRRRCGVNKAKRDADAGWICIRALPLFAMPKLARLSMSPPRRQANRNIQDLRRYSALECGISFAIR